MKKIHAATPCTRITRKISKVGIVAAVVAAALCVTAAGVAAIKWGGFAFTEGMSDAEKRALLQNASEVHGYVYQDDRGYVHYVDETGEETLVLSAEEAAEYEREQKAAKERAVLESTTLVDASTLPLLPHLITELGVDAEGRFAECALGNGSMILLHPEGESGFELQPGDIVTIELTGSDDKCILQFGQFKNGVFVGGESVKTRQHRYTFVIEEAGLYCFSVQNYSTDAKVVADCTLTVE